MQDLKQQGIAHFNAKRFNEALPLLAQSLQQNQADNELNQYLGKTFAALGRNQEAIAMLVTALKKGASDPDLLYTMSGCFYGVHNLDKAIEAMENFLALKPNHPKAKRLLVGMQKEAVPIWHFPMMNDEERNAAFNKAISGKINPNTVVLEIGTGSGLLAMMAARAGAKHVYTLETVYSIAKVAKEIIRDNGLSDRITVIHKNALQLELEKDIPEKADVLIAEIIGGNLLDEGIIQVMNAIRPLLKENAAIIPCRAEMYAALIESESAKALFRVEHASGFDLQRFNLLHESTLLQLNMNYFPHSVLTNAQCVFHFDFTKPLLSQEKNTFTLNVEKEGTAHAWMAWYRLYLDKNIFIETAPRTIMSHWKQSIQALPQAKRLVFGDQINISAEHDGKQIFLALS
jgi:tetratricopeptide (TPR) repeat protein